MLQIRTACIISLIAAAVYISACTPTASTSLPSATAEFDAPSTSTSADVKSQPLLRTEQGDFAIASARLVDEANGAKPLAGEKILLVILARPDLAKLDPSEFSLETFSNMLHNSNGEIYILGNDGSQTISTMSGWVQDEFTLGFRVPFEIETYTLYWPGNSPIDLNVQE